MGGPYIQAKIVELALDQHRVLRKLIDEWVDLMQATQTAQIQEEHRRAWGRQAFRPWPITSLEEMAPAAILGICDRHEMGTECAGGAGARSKNKILSLEFISSL